MGSSQLHMLRGEEVEERERIHVLCPGRRVVRSELCVPRCELCGSSADAWPSLLLHVLGPRARHFWCMMRTSDRLPRAVPDTVCVARLVRRRIHSVNWSTSLLPQSGDGEGRFNPGRGGGRGYLNDKQIVPPHAVWRVGTPQPYLHIFFFSPLTSLIS